MRPSVQRWLAGRWLPLLAAAALIGLILMLYGRFLLRPADFFVGDLVSLFQPLRHHYAASLRHGELPLWTSAIFAGTPTFTDPQLAAFYPGTTLHLACDYPRAELASFLLHLILGGLGFLWLARSVKLGWAPAVLAAMSYSLSGFFAVHLVHPNFIHTAAWMPWVAGALRRLIEWGQPRHAALSALTVGLALLAGGLQLAYYGLAAALVLSACWAAAEGSLPPRQRLLRFGMAAGAVLLGVALAAIQLVPTAEFSALSVRSDGVTLELARSYRLPARGALQLLVPYLYGLPGKTPYLGGQNFHEAFAYCGIVTVPLALTALGRWKAERWVLAGLALLALLAAAGPEAPIDLHRALYAAAPGFDRFRAHGRLLFLVVFGLSLLAAFGLHDLLYGGAEDRPRARRLHLAFTLLVLGVGLSAWLGATGRPSLLPPAAATLARASALGAAAAALGCWVVIAGGWRLRLGPAWIAIGVLAIHAVDLLGAGRLLLQQQNPPAGVDTARRAHRLPPHVQQSAHRDHRVLFAPDCWYMLQNLGMQQGFDNLRAYGPMMLRRTYDLLHHAQHGRFAPWKRLPVDQNLIRVGRYDSPVLKLLGVRHVLRHNRPPARPGTLVPLSYRVQELPQALPRAFVVYRTERPPDRPSREARLRDFDPAQVALVETPAAALRTPGGESATPASVRHRSPGGARVTLEVDTPRAGLLVFAESWYPGWRARVDGKEVDVHRVNHALMGIKVPAGHHRIRLTFAPRSLRWGAVLSLLALLGILLLALGPLAARKLFRRNAL
ncbi:MAG: YfhO family protein [bacterium]